MKIQLEFIGILTNPKQTGSIHGVTEWHHVIQTSIDREKYGESNGVY